MSWTKRQLVLQAFDEIALGSSEFDIDEESLQSALLKMEAMIAMWSGKGIHIGYPLASEPENASLDTETDIPGAANESVYLNLALRIAPSHGKAVSMETRIAAKNAYKAMVVFAKSEEIPTMQMPGWVPIGAGKKPWRDTRRPFVDEPDTSPLTIDSDGKLQFNRK